MPKTAAYSAPKKHNKKDQRGHYTIFSKENSVSNILQRPQRSNLECVTQEGIMQLKKKKICGSKIFSPVDLWQFFTSNKDTIFY